MTADNKAMIGLTLHRDQVAVLLIDDDLVSREVTATVLTLNGYTVHTADSGAAALELLATASPAPEVILMDAQMPGLSGTKLIGEIRAQSKARILAISGSILPPEVINAADGFLIKPFEVEAMQKVLDRRVSQEAASTAVSMLEPDAPVINLEVLAQLRALMPEPAVRQIYRAIVTDLDQRAKVLETALAKGDMAEVSRIGHAIKGGCAMAGASQAARLGALIEKAARTAGGNQLDNGAVLIGDLRAAARALESMLDPELPS
ncbi:MAG TPA: response regulator [Terracidiphilus sp.]|nr:response regulator [Terracidiphilus sp.]